ncbi:hypothetical protein B0I35DRAFT_183032 [Stachybotrys elegans]|uniref:DUF7580 domain-containing protein n=1 Tax=Stachybotrys elegans TaxID=80388 RepID=A0A8K0WUE3_9HYPO|nr:hypothetical protein B0I35DRAFT_183032 [Stachybotrys elegans]
MAADNSTKIYDLSWECEKAFERALMRDTSGSSPVVEVLHQQFGQWAAQLGALAHPSVSLDTRLRTSESLRSLIIQFLLVARRNLDRIESMEHNEKGIQSSDSIIAQMNPEDKTGVASLLVESLQALESAIDGLQRLGSAIRQSSSGDVTQRIQAFKDKKDNGSIEALVSFRLRSLASHAEPGVTPRVQGDVNPIRGATSSLCEQLAVSISFRYFGVLYRRSHGKRLAEKHQAPARVPVIPAQQLIQPVPQPSKSMSNPSESKAGGQKLSAIPPHVHPRPNPSESAPSVLNSEAARKKHASSEKSVVSTASVISMQLKHFRYPRPPTIIPPATSAICPYCYRRFSKRDYDKKGWWGRHLKQDLKLYTCISEECCDPPQLFMGYEEWKQHMEVEHSRTWMEEVHRLVHWCCEIDHEEEWFHDEASFEAHIRAKHPAYTGVPELTTLKEWCEVPLERPAYTCPICNCVPEKLWPLVAQKPGKRPLRSDSTYWRRTSKPVDQNGAYEELLRHVAAHLRQIGMMAIAYLDGDDDDEGVMDGQNASGGGVDRQAWLPPGFWRQGEWVSKDTAWIPDLEVDPDYKEDTARILQSSTLPESDIDWKDWDLKLHPPAPDSLVQLNRDMLTLAEGLLGAEHPDIIGFLERLGRSLESQVVTLLDAEITYRRACDLSAKLLGPDSATTFKYTRYLASVLTQQGKDEESEKLMDIANNLMTESDLVEHRKLRWRDLVIFAFDFLSCKCTEESQRQIALELVPLGETAELVAFVTIANPEVFYYEMAFLSLPTRKMKKKRICLCEHMLSNPYPKSFRQEFFLHRYSYISARVALATRKYSHDAMQTNLSMADDSFFQATYWSEDRKQGLASCLSFSLRQLLVRERGMLVAKEWWSRPNIAFFRGTTLPFLCATVPPAGLGRSWDDESTDSHNGEITFHRNPHLLELGIMLLSIHLHTNACEPPNASSSRRWISALELFESCRESIKSPVYCQAIQHCLRPVDALSETLDVLRLLAEESSELARWKFLGVERPAEDEPPRFRVRPSDSQLSTESKSVTPLNRATQSGLDVETTGNLVRQFVLSQNQGDEREVTQSLPNVQASDAPGPGSPEICLGAGGPTERARQVQLLDDDTGLNMEKHLFTIYRTCFFDSAFPNLDIVLADRLATSMILRRKKFQYTQLRKVTLSDQQVVQIQDPKDTASSPTPTVLRRVPTNFIASHGTESENMARIGDISRFIPRPPRVLQDQDMFATCSA